MRPIRPIGFFPTARSSIVWPGLSRALVISTGNGPGAIALCRMPCRPHWTASDSVITCRPAFDIAEGTT
jgi:hypothetical protein